MTAGVPAREHLLQNSKAIVLYKHLALGCPQCLHMIDEAIKVITIIGYVLTAMVSMAFNKAGDLAFFFPVDAFDECDAEFAVINAPNFRTAFAIWRRRRCV